MSFCGHFWIQNYVDRLWICFFSIPTAICVILRSCLTMAPTCMIQHAYHIPMHKALHVMCAPWWTDCMYSVCVRIITCVSDMHGVSHMWYTCTADVIWFACIMDANKDVCHVCCPTYTISYAHHGKAWYGTMDTCHKQVVTGWMSQWVIMCLSHLTHAVGCAWFAYEWYSMSDL